MKIVLQEDQEQWEKINSQPVDPDSRPDDIPLWVKDMGSPYHAEGLKPSYTGFVPRKC